MNVTQDILLPLGAELAKLMNQHLPGCHVLNCQCLGHGDWRAVCPPGLGGEPTYFVSVIRAVDIECPRSATAGIDLFPDTYRKKIRVSGCWPRYANGGFMGAPRLYEDGRESGTSILLREGINVGIETAQKNPEKVAGDILRRYVRAYCQHWPARNEQARMDRVSKKAQETIIERFLALGCTTNEPNRKEGKLWFPRGDGSVSGDVEVQHGGEVVELKLTLPTALALELVRGLLAKEPA